MNKRFLITIATLVFIAVIAIGASFMAKGYTFSTKQGKMVGTGIISATSSPEGASVYIDGHLATATNTTVSQLSPKSYSVKIVKEGFVPWEKTVEVKEGLVTEVKATLFPALPTIYPLTYNGVLNPIVSPDGQKLAFTVPLTTDSHNRQRGGVWVWTFTSQAIAINRSSEPHQLVVSTPALDFSKSSIRWSADSKQILATLQEGGVTGEVSQRNYLLTFDKLASMNDLRDITATVKSTIKDWEDDQKTKEEVRVLTIQDIKLQKIASSSAVVKWSLDETKILVGDKSLKDSDKKPIAKDYLTGYKIYALPADGVSTYKEYDLPPALAYFWLPDSRHVITILEDKVGIVEYDGSNLAIVYAGSFNPLAIFPWPDSSRLGIITSYSTPTASQPNLFGINLK